MNQHIEIKDLQEIVIDYLSGPKLYWKFRNYDVLKCIPFSDLRNDNFRNDDIFWESDFTFLKYKNNTYDFMPLYFNQIFIYIHHRNNYDGPRNIVDYICDNRQERKSLIITLISDYYGLLNDFVDYVFH